VIIVKIKGIDTNLEANPMSRHAPHTVSIEAVRVAEKRGKGIPRVLKKWTTLAKWPNFPSPVTKKLPPQKRRMSSNKGDFKRSPMGGNLE